MTYIVCPSVVGTPFHQKKPDFQCLLQVYGDIRCAVLHVIKVGVPTFRSALQGATAASVVYQWYKNGHGTLCTPHSTERGEWAGQPHFPAALLPGKERRFPLTRRQGGKEHLLFLPERSRSPAQLHCPACSDKYDYWRSCRLPQRYRRDPGRRVIPAGSFGTDSLSRNVGSELPVYAAYTPQKGVDLNMYYFCSGQTSEERREASEAEDDV